MQERIEAELTLLRQRFSEAEYLELGHWVRIPSYPLPEGWTWSSTEVAFQIPVDRGYPGTPLYGIYVPSGIRFEGSQPDNYNEPAGTQPPFPGAWGVFSWTPESGEWRPTDDLRKGSNLLNWAMGIAVRFRQGR